MKPSKLSAQVAEIQRLLDSLATSLEAASTQAAAHDFEGPLEDFEVTYRLSLEELATELPSCRIGTVDLSRVEYEKFLRSVIPWHETIGKRTDHKKKLELFASYTLLGELLTGAYLDAAGGGFSYAGGIPARRAVIQDLSIREAVRKRSGPSVEYLESSLSKIPLPDESIDAISAHHAFEHFQGSADHDFIDEVQRILKPGGKAVIVPLFVSRSALEMTNRHDFDNWSIDPGRRVVDIEATLPGKLSGNFARIYDSVTFDTRVLSRIDGAKFEVSITELTLEGRPIPDPVVYKNHKVSNFNYPYRAFTLERLG